MSQETTGEDGPAPTVSIGLPVYNGQRYLREALDSLLAQTFTDFELVISDNASNDSTVAIIEEYAGRDRRIRHVRQPVNIGAARNHNVVVELARGRYFKFASHDDLYDPDFVRLCVQALDDHPEAVLAHSWHGYIDTDGTLISADPYPLDTANPSPRLRLRSILRTPGGADFYGLLRTDVIKSVRPHQTYYHADRTYVAGWALAGPFHHLPRTLYYLREHPGRASHGDRRAKAAALGPERADRLRHPMARMYAEYVFDFVRAVWTAPMSWRERLGCLSEIAGWGVDAARPGRRQLTADASSAG